MSLYCTNALSPISLISLQAATLKPSILQVDACSRAITVIQLFSALVHIWRILCFRKVLVYNDFLQYVNKEAVPRTHIPLQTLPSPVKPDLQLHWKLPSVLVQSAFSEQSSLLVAHSSTSA